MDLYKLHALQACKITTLQGCRRREGLTLQQIEQDPARHAAKVEAVAAPDLEKMGMTVVGFSIQNMR